MPDPAVPSSDDVPAADRGLERLRAELAAPARSSPDLHAWLVLLRHVTARPAAAAVVVGLSAVLLAAVVAYATLADHADLRPAPVEDALPRATTAPDVSDADRSGAPPGPGPGTLPPDSPPTVWVHVAGAVVLPGVNELRADGRTADALAAAGGPTADADLDRVNLAAPLVDGSRLYVPRAGEAAPPPVVDAGPGPAAGGGTAASSNPGPVDVNRANVDELDALPGVGPVTAAAIVDDRERNGPFTSVDDLARVSGIGPTRLERLRPLVVAG